MPKEQGGSGETKASAVTCEEQDLRSLPRVLVMSLFFPKRSKY